VTVFIVGDIIFEIKVTGKSDKLSEMISDWFRNLN